MLTVYIFGRRTSADAARAGVADAPSSRRERSLGAAVGRGLDVLPGEKPSHILRDSGLSDAFYDRCVARVAILEHSRPSGGTMFAVVTPETTQLVPVTVVVRVRFPPDVEPRIDV
jgi:hypothetical protein